MSPTTLFVVLVAWAWLLTSAAALIALMLRRPISRRLGIISIACLVAWLLTSVVGKGRPLSWKLGFVFLLDAVPGALAIVFKPMPRIPPGHCKTCGYNLTGNVSGVCSECGAVVPAPGDRMNTIR